MNSSNLDNYAKNQAELFEKSAIEHLNSSIFVKRFMFSFYSKLMDDDTYRLSPYGDDYVYARIKEETNSKGTIYNPEIMRWCGYIYRYLCNYLHITSKKAFQLVPLSYMVKAYVPYHTVSPIKAILEIIKDNNIVILSKEEKIKKIMKL